MLQQTTTKVVKSIDVKTNEALPKKEVKFSEQDLVLVEFEDDSTKQDKEQESQK